MSSGILRVLLVLFIGTLTASKSDDEIIALPSIDIPSDGKGLVPAGNGTSNNTTVILPDPSIPSVLGTVYRYTLGPVVNFLVILLGPILSLVRGITSPVLGIVNYLLGSLGLPNLSALLNEVLIGLEGFLGKLLGQVSGFVGALLGPQENTQSHSRRRRSIVGSMMSTLMSPVTMPWKILSSITSLITSPFSWGYWGLSYPASGAMSLGGWSTRGILRMFGFGTKKDDAGDDGADGNNGDDSEVDPIADLVGTMSETVQDAMTGALLQGFEMMKSNILPTIDSTFESYQDSNIVPDSLKGYMKSFHQGYSLLHTLRIL